MNEPAPILPTAVYGPARPPEQVPPDLRLTSLEWGTLFSISGRHTLAQVARRLEVPVAAAGGALARLVELGLAVERGLTFNEYVRAAATLDDTEPKTLAAFLRGLPARPAATAPVGPDLDAPDADSGAEPSAATDPPRGATSTPTPLRPGPPVPMPFRPLALPEQEQRMRHAPAANPTFNLGDVVRFIVDRAGDPERGQLDVYRVFLRVDPDLMRRAGVTTLRFEEDLVVRDAELVARVLASVEETLGARFPGAAGPGTPPVTPLSQALSHPDKPR